MKNLFALTMMNLILVGCDAPQRTRNGIYNSGSEGFMANSSGSSGSGSSGGWWEAGNSSGGTSSSGSSSGGLGVGFESCDFSNSAYASTIGHTGLCQSSLDETIVKIKTSIGDSAAKNCLIPTYKDGAGSSTYLGQPQCFFPQENVVTQGKLYKNRNGTFGTGVAFVNLPLNGLMIMKEASLPAYFNCMNAIPNFRDIRCPYHASTAPYYINGTLISCSVLANSYMNTVCNDFKVVHPYIDIRLKP